jgi:hypothetical protein
MLWKELVLACIGEQFALILEPTDEINGISLGIRYDEKNRSVEVIRSEQVLNEFIWIRDSE